MENCEMSTSDIIDESAPDCDRDLTERATALGKAIERLRPDDDDDSYEAKAAAAAVHRLFDHFVNQLSGSTLDYLHAAVDRSTRERAEIFAKIGRAVRDRVKQVGAAVAMAELDAAEHLFIRRPRQARLNRARPHPF
jgi:hypothetical protein